VGGAFQDSTGKIMALFSMWMGNNMNNGVKLAVMVKGLKLAIEMVYNSLIAERDS
jgi:hypothetical protein